MVLPWGYIKRVLAGALFGLYMAHLLYFLNPQIEITPGRLLLVTLTYGLICGFLFGSILWGLRILRLRIFGRPEGAEHRRQGFGLIVVAAFISAGFYLLHLAAFRIYLPYGAVGILSKATVAITLTAILLLALWLVERRARTNVSRAILATGCILIITSSVFLYQRRERYRPNRKTVVVADVGTLAGSRPLIFVSIRNLPYDWIVTMVGEGDLPFFEQSMKSGYLTRLNPFPSRTSKELWASLATGQLPHRHGVTGGYSYKTLLTGPDRLLILPSGVGFRVWGLIPPVERFSAELPAGESLPFWALFRRLGIDSAVINWPGMPPFDAQQQPVEVPEAVRARISIAGRGGQVTRQLQSDLSAGEASKQALRSGERVVASALNGFSLFQPLVGINTNELPDRVASNGSAVRAYLQQVDAILGELHRTSPEALVVVVSTAGPDPAPFPGSLFALLRLLLERRDPGSDDGFVLFLGNGIRSGQGREPARIVDVVPTLLFASGLPTARDLDGRVLTEAFDETFLENNSLSIIQTYEAERILVRRGRS